MRQLLKLTCINLEAFNLLKIMGQIIEQMCLSFSFIRLPALSLSDVNRNYVQNSNNKEMNK